jgi:hypothetical protein
MDYSELGDFIGDEAPYGRQVTLPDRTDPKIKKIGLAKGNHADSAFPKGKEDLTSDEQLQCVYWYFPEDGGPPQVHRVTKAIRVPYSYIRTSDGSVQTASLLIGYNGPSD